MGKNPASTSAPRSKTAARKPAAAAPAPAAPLHEGIGQKLRQRRKVRQFSLSEVAARANISIGLLSQIERGLSAPSLRSLRQICQALEMPLGWLFESEDPQRAGEEQVVVRKPRRRRMVLGAAGMTKEILSPDTVPQLQLMRMIIHPEGRSGDSPNQHATGAKTGTVLAGRLGLEIDGRRYLLDQGDSFAFHATSQYRFWCEGDVDCDVLWAVTPALY
ncbi:XRE family transcriptional regulator [Orrella sp. JC864]|uniref:helix-turn-helix domain-containing protein n=1 Tax=Orrella sp. JC864 TaxID=3120298 RepID=UPI0012BCEA59